LGVLVAALVTAAILVGSVGAGTARTGALQLTSTSAVESYLRSIGVNPKTVVFQRGHKNYAGPKCPGKQWTCTSAKRVVQMAKNSGENKFVCDPAGQGTNPAENRCVIVQVSTSSRNDAFCNISRNDDAGGSANITQTCSITQTNESGRNRADVDQTIFERFGSSQGGTQDVTVQQSNQSGANTTTVNQKLDQWSDYTPPVPSIAQEGHQDVSVTQSSTSGKNSSTIYQVLGQTARTSVPGAISQLQNVTDAGPNTSASVSQTSASGSNTSSLEQHNDLTALASSDTSVTQRQGSFTGGLKGHVDQTSSAVSTNNAKQFENQSAHADTPPGTLTQVQIGPFDCCETQLGNGGNVSSITQRGHQESDGGSQFDTAHAHCTTSGSCTTTQHKDNDVDSIDDTNSCTGSVEFPCTVDNTVECTGDGCQTVEEEGSPDSELTKGVCDNSANSGECFPSSATETGANGDEYRYGITYLNAGTADAHDVTVKDTLPPGMFFQECLQECSYDSETRTITWSLGTVEADTQRDLQFLVNSDANSCSVTNTASATTAEEEGTTTSNPAVVTFDNCG
jgi:uncharacterized repeat protein (TIGR01451 family)